jgi:hypothetical protein
MSNAIIPDARSKPSAITLDPLPEKVPPGEPYSVPDTLLENPGHLFAYICAACYGSDVLKLTEFFDVSRQTFWIWRKTGMGVPEPYRPDVERLIADPQQPFRLPENATIDDFMRPPRDQQSGPVREPKQNFHLISLLHAICDHEEFGHATLPTLIGQMSRPVSNPYVFYRWAWAVGGVPRSYVPAFITALMQLRVYTIFGYTEGNAVQWEGMNTRTLAAPIDAEDDAEAEES